MDISIKYKVLQIDTGRMSKALDAAIREQVKFAMKAFLEAAVVKVPVLTGMARGGFIPLGKFVGVTIDIPNAKPKPSRNKIIGASLAELDTSNLKYPQYVFDYRIDIVHFNLLDPTKWRAFAAGRKALDKYLHKEFVKNLPKIKKYITSTEVSKDFVMDIKL